MIITGDDKQDEEQEEERLREYSFWDSSFWQMLCRVLKKLLREYEDEDI